MSDIFEDLKNIEKETEERIAEIKENEAKRKLEEEEAKRKAEMDEEKGKLKSAISEIIENPILELDEPKLWGVSYSFGNPINLNITNDFKIVVMTERQKMLLEETGRLSTLYGSYGKLKSLEEMPRKELSDIEKTKLEGLKQKIELLKTSTDPKLDEKGVYISTVKYEKVETEMTLRQALLATTPETRDCFKTYTQIKEDEEEKKRLEEERKKQDNKKSSKITFKSIKDAIKSKLNIR